MRSRLRHIALASAVAAAGAADAVPHAKHTSVVQAALDRREAAAARARQAFATALAAADKQLSRDMDGVLHRAMADGSLDQANDAAATKSEADGRIKVNPAAPEVLYATVVHQRAYVYTISNTAPRRMEFNPDGHVGVGSGTYEREWWVTIRAGQAHLVLNGERGQTEATADPNGAFSGSWGTGGQFTMVPVTAGR